MPIMIADSNMLRNPVLNDYLRASRSNRIAIAQEVLMETHKREPILTIRQCFKQARVYPIQVLILKGVTLIYGMPLRSAADTRKLIDPLQTANFTRWYDDVCAAVNDPEMNSQLATAQRQAQKRLNEITNDVGYLEPIFRRMKSRFTKEEQKQLRDRKSYEKSTQEKLLNLVYDVSADLFHVTNVPARFYPNLNYQAHRYFIFRYAMCITLLYARWVHWGNLPRDNNKICNHIVDMHLAALSTFFQGIMTDDALLIDVHREARYLLRVGQRAFVG